MRPLFLLLFLSFTLQAVENEYFPLIEDSTYSYNAVHKGRKLSLNLVIKSETHFDREGVFFVAQEQRDNPDALIGYMNIGGGVYFNDEGVVSVLSCHDVAAAHSLAFKSPTVLLQNPPTVGQVSELKSSDGQLTEKFTIVGTEDVTVPAGMFKACLKIKLEDTDLGQKEKEKQTHSGWAWLAKGVGLVKWERVTGRVDELAAYKIAEPKPKPTKKTDDKK